MRSNRPNGTHRHPAPGQRRELNPQRRALYAKIQIAKKQVGMEDDDYRAMLMTRYGQSSLTQLTHDQLGDVVKHFISLGFKPKRRAVGKAGARSLDQNPSSRKIRALWLSLHALCLVDDPSEKALAAFVKRQAGVDDLRWLTPGQTYKVVEALKAWAERDAGVSWQPFAGVDGPVHKPRVRVVRALWAHLHEAGVVRNGSDDALNIWAERALKWPAETSVLSLPDEAADRLIILLGQWLRKARQRDAS